ncbi:MAG: Methyltransferase type 11 [Paenibacillaceae bacterium]|nr:Methyltransferase type 11 [Paenibacillaceae bacterium]
MSFYETLSRYYDEIFPAAPAQVDFVAKQTVPGGRILDVAAGTGNLAAALSERGYSVTAIDVDPSMVDQMKKKQESPGATGFETLLLDMRGLDNLPAEGYETVVCVGNSLVHLNDLTEIADAVIGMFDRLKPGGALILQNVNYDRILRDHVKELPVIERKLADQTITFRRLYELEEDGILFHGRLSVKGAASEEEYENRVRLLPMQSDELLQIAEQYGLPVPEFYGNYQGEAYTAGSTALVAVLRKRG